MVIPLFSKGSVVRILASGQIATVLSLVDDFRGKESLAYVIENDDINMHHFLSTSEIELNEIL